MERLIASNMIYGGLMEISQSHLVNNYNVALSQFGFRPVAPDKFFVDAMGFSPEIAELLEDPDYLNPHRVNPRFIILSPRQAELPYVQVSFSSTPELMRAFYKANKSALDVLTLKDVIFGEIENYTFTVQKIEDLLSIRHVQFELQSAHGVLNGAKRLLKLVDRFEREATSWDNSKLMKEMVELASLCGDVRKNNGIPNITKFEKNAFWVDHFGGIYILHDDDGHVVIGAPATPPFPSKAGREDWYISLEESRVLYDYLTETDRLEPFNRDWLIDTKILETRIDQHIRAFIALSEKGMDVDKLSAAAVRKWISTHGVEISGDRVLSFLTRFQKDLLTGKPINLDSVSHDLLFLVQRARPERDDAGLINRLIAEYIPFDFVTRFIVNKEAFYRDYENYPDALKDYVVNLISTTYFKDKDLYWQRLFG